jgi:hypothetical protein
MKSKLFGALIVSVCCLTGQSYGFGLLDTMLGSGCGCDSCERQCCCEESCGCADDCCSDGCCGDDSCCEASCGCASSCCCKKERSCALSKLFKRKSKCGCCEASCGCSDGCCGDNCCGDGGDCEKSCGCADDCCSDGCCGDDSCCEASCGCASSCCCKKETPGVPRLHQQARRSSNPKLLQSPRRLPIPLLGSHSPVRWSALALFAKQRI